MVKISVIIPVYNGEKYLKKCINSVLNQTLKDIEIILVNDGSTDRSEEIINEYISKNENKIIKYNQVNSGQAVARNKGIELARGEYITFVDCDDYINETMLEDLYNEAINKQLDIIICDYYEERNGELIYKKQIQKEHSNIVKDYVLYVAGPCNKIIKADILKKNNIYFPKDVFYEDIAIMPSLAIYTDKIGYIKKAYYYYYIRENSTMRQKQYNAKLDTIFWVLNYLKSNFIKKHAYEEYKNELEYIFIEHLLFGANGRFLMFDNRWEKLGKTVKVMKTEFPNWGKNKYFKEKNIVYKITCLIFYSQNKLLIKIYNKVKKIKR